MEAAMAEVMAGLHDKVTDSASYKKLKFLETAKHYVSERRDGSPPTTEVTGVRA